MLKNLFIGAARDLRAEGWIQPNTDKPMLFHHPEFGTHDFFKACYIQCNAIQIRRRKRLIAVGCYVVGAFILCGAALLIYTAILGLLL